MAPSTKFNVTNVVFTKVSLNLFVAIIFIVALYYAFGADVESEPFIKSIQF